MSADSTRNSDIVSDTNNNGYGGQVQQNTRSSKVNAPMLPWPESTSNSTRNGDIVGDINNIGDTV